MNDATCCRPPEQNGLLVMLYLDTSVLAGVEERHEQGQLAKWLDDHGHRPLISDVHLVEAPAISDEEVRNRRLDHLVALRSNGPFLMPVGYLEAGEYVAEVKRRHPGWLEPFPRTDAAQRFLRDARQRWRQARTDRGSLPLQRRHYATVAEPSIRRSRGAQKDARALRRVGYDAIDGFALDRHHVALSGPVRADDYVATFPLVAIGTWYAALYQRAEHLRDLADYARPYLRPGISESAFIAFWLSDLEPRNLPRALSGHIVAEEQLKAKIGHGNSNDVNHSTFAIDADAFVTADEAFFLALRAVPPVISEAAQPVLVDRGSPSIVAQLSDAF